MHKNHTLSSTDHKQSRAERVAKTESLAAVGCVQVRQKRQDRYHEARMRKAKVQQSAQEKAELERDINLVRETAPGEEEEEIEAPMEVRSTVITPVLSQLYSQTERVSLALSYLCVMAHVGLP